MIINIVAYTDKGFALADKLKSLLNEDIVVINNSDADALIKKSFEIRCPLIFIGAMGIAVRKISAHIDSKLIDPPVIVIDEGGKAVIPILSGHLGGGNELAAHIAGLIDAKAIITTATDIENVFSVDIYAKNHNLGIVNKDGIKLISQKALRGENITIWDVRDKGYEPDCRVDVLIDDKKIQGNAILSLYPKRYFLGIGCKKDTPYDKIERLADIVLSENKISYDEIAQIGSIDLKKKEYGLNEYSHRHGLKLTCFTRGELKALEGDFTASDFVNTIVGVDNVCERAAYLLSGKGSFVVRKTTLDGVSIAVCRSYD